MQEIRNYIDGEQVAGARWFEKRSPVDGRVIARVGEAGAAGIDAAVRAARAAVGGPWGRFSAGERGELVHAVAREIRRRFDDFLAAEVADTGKPLELARDIDIPRGAANFEAFADLVKQMPTELF